MTKDGFISELTKDVNTGTDDVSISKAIVQKVIDTMFQTTIPRATYVGGEKIGLRPYGTFECRTLKAGVGHDPRTNEAIAFGSRYKVVFSPGKALKWKDQ